MPYIVTTTVEGAPEPDTWAEHDARTTRTAVATLDEAREEVRNHISNEVAADTRVIESLWTDAESLPESGGTIGPLPDGTVIEVQRIPLDRLREMADMTHYNATEETILAAYNEAQR